MTKSALALARVIAGIMVRGQFMMNGFIQLDAPFLDVLLQKVMYAEKLDALIGIPFLQTKPGRIVGVASFRQDQVLTLQVFVILDDAPDNLLHGLVIAGEKTPVDPFPVFRSGRP